MVFLALGNWVQREQLQPRTVPGIYAAVCRHYESEWDRHAIGARSGAHLVLISKSSKLSVSRHLDELVYLLAGKDPIEAFSLR